VKHPIGEPIAARIRELIEEVMGFLGVGQVSLNSIASLIFAARLGMDDSYLTRGDIQQAFRELRKSVWTNVGANVEDISDAEIAADLSVSMMLRWLNRYPETEEAIANLFGKYCFEDHDPKNFVSVAKAQTLFVRMLEIRQFANEFCDEIALKYMRSRDDQD
jgi:hypothetical protein